MRSSSSKKPPEASEPFVSLGVVRAATFSYSTAGLCLLWAVSPSGEEQRADAHNSALQEERDTARKKNQSGSVERCRECRMRFFFACVFVAVRIVQNVAARQLCRGALRTPVHLFSFARKTAPPLPHKILSPLAGFVPQNLSTAVHV